MQWLKESFLDPIIRMAGRPGHAGIAPDASYETPEKSAHRGPAAGFDQSACGRSAGSNQFTAYRTASPAAGDPGHLPPAFFSNHNGANILSQPSDQKDPTTIAEVPGAPIEYRLCWAGRSVIGNAKLLKCAAISNISGNIPAAV